MPRTRPAIGNPFPGSRPFRADEDFLFFGRENQVNAMVDKLARTRLLAVVGSSGSGKSSLVNCGLRPALHRGLMAAAGTSWRVAQFRPGGNPIRSMARALAADGVLFEPFADQGISLPDMVEATLRMSKLGLVDIFEQSPRPAGTNLLVVADQFEELFRYRGVGDPAEQAQRARAQDAVAFVNLLLEAAAQRAFPIHVVLTMRSDFLGDCALMPGLPEAINEGQYLVPRMTREELRSAIAGPVRVGDAVLSPVLLTRLVNDVGDNPDQLSILQHALNRTWARWENDDGRTGPLDLAQYEAIGTMANALDQHAEKAFGELRDAATQRTCEVMFKALTDRGSDARGIRRPTSVKALCDLSGADVPALTRVIDVFRKPSRSFLMPPLNEVLEPDTIVDISHESLMRVWKRLVRWTDDEAESAVRYRRLAESAALYRDGEAVEMADPELSLMLKWREEQQPTAPWAERYVPGFELAESFLEKSRRKRDAEANAVRERNRRQLRNARILTVAAVATAMVVVGVAALVLAQRSENAQLKDALEKARVATEQAVAARAESEAALRKEQATAAAAMAAIKSLSDLKTHSANAQGAAQTAKASSKKEDADTYTQTSEKEWLRARGKEQEVQTSLAKLAAISAGGVVLSPSRVSASDLFDISGGAQVTGTSAGVTNENTMFRAADPKNDRDAAATYFGDKMPELTTHWITWRLPRPATVGSVALFAKHDAPIDGYQFRRAMRTFRVFARDGGDWVQLADYQPVLPYGGGADGTSLAVCLPVKAVRATEFKAEFVQAVNVLGQYSAPRVIALDGFAGGSCSSSSSSGRKGE